jgi:ureidoacrylate peracid hydrolase
MLAGVGSAAFSLNQVGPSKAKIELSARPEPFVFDCSNAAVVVVDMQNDFGAKGGLLDRTGKDISVIQKAVPPTQGDTVMYKTRFTGFYETNLDHTLKAMGVKHLIVSHARPVSASNRRFEMRCSATIAALSWRTAPVSRMGSTWRGAITTHPFC